MHKDLPIALALTLLTGCVTLEARTARQTGCPEGDVQISDERGAIEKTWRASCGNQTYICTYKPQSSEGAGGIAVTTPEQETCIAEGEEPG